MEVFASPEVIRGIGVGFWDYSLRQYPTRRGRNAPKSRLLIRNFPYHKLTRL
jgi:hypothetical protein